MGKTEFSEGNTRQNSERGERVRFLILEEKPLE